ncbi:MAG: D-alanine--D-alanine ligase [Oscillospiraceae bacterium]|nr:D-alanine--D-alanine ligase [Oscillospiraceae bacterium]
MNIVVLCGGLSAERNVSLTTGAKVQNALVERGHHAIAADLFMGYELSGTVEEAFAAATVPMPVQRISEEVPDLEALKAQRGEDIKGIFGKNIVELCQYADIVFMALHGADGENGRLQAAFDMLGVKYTGSGYLGSAVAMNKSLSKQAFLSDGILTPKSVHINKGADAQLDGMNLPLVVKPCSGGSSIGVFIANTEEELKNGLEEAFRFENEVLVEEYIKGRELTCGILGGRTLPPVEIIPKDGWYDYKNKYQPGLTVEICPAEITPEEEKAISDATQAAFKSLRLEGYARMDFILTEDGKAYCLEANTLPGMTPTSLIPQEAAAIGMSYGELCEEIIRISLE